MPLAHFVGAALRGEYTPVGAAEEREVLLEMARRRSGAFPALLLVERALSVTEGTDWSSRRAALEALLRRLSFAQRDELSIVKRPDAGRMLGLYSLAGKQVQNGTKSKRRVVRPYRTALYGIEPVLGSCDCPDFVRGCLGLCKHLLTVIESVVSGPKKRAQALQEQATGQANATMLRWDPVRDWRGEGDRLQGLFIDAASASSKKQDGKRRSGRSSGRQIKLETWLEGGRPKPENLTDLSRRVRMLRELEAACVDGALCAEPAAQTVVRQELARSERRQEARADAPKIASHLKSIKRKLYAYQLHGVERFLEERRLLLADDMGLGKTTQAIAACHALHVSGRVARGLVIVPAPLKAQWVREWEATTAKVPVTLVEGRASERTKLYRNTKSGFLVINYEQLLRDLPEVHRFAPEVVVLDEAQRIKNWATKSSAYVMTLRPEWRLVLTGTPMENRLEELATILDWVDDTALAPKWRLVPWHTSFDPTDGSRIGARNLETLRARLRPSMVRRVRREVLSQLPSRTDTRLPVEVTPEQREEMDGLSVPIGRLIKTGHRRPLQPAEFLRLMQLLAQQRMASNGVALLRFDQVWPTYSKGRADAAILRGMGSPKLAELQRVIEELVVEQGRKVVVFSQWRKMLSLAEWATRDLLKQQGLRSVFFTGNESQHLRTRNIALLHDDPDVRVMFLTDAGGVGLNLQRAATACVNLELPWNPAVLEQRIGRIYRLGQEHPIDVVNLVSEYGIEARIAGLVQNKKALFSGLFDGVSDEVLYDKPSGFLKEIERLIEPIEVPELPLGPGSQSPATLASPTDDDLDHLEVVPWVRVARGRRKGSDESGAGGAVLSGVAVRDGGQSPIDASAGAEGERPEAEHAPPTERGAESVAKWADAPPTPARVAALLSGVEVMRTENGGLRLDAEPAAAAELAGLLEGLAKLLRGVSHASE